MIKVADFCLGLTLLVTSCCLVTTVVSSTITRVAHSLRRYKVDKYTAKVQEEAQRTYLNRIKEMSIQDFINTFGGNK